MLRRDPGREGLVGVRSSEGEERIIRERVGKRQRRRASPRAGKEALIFVTAGRPLRAFLTRRPARKHAAIHTAQDTQHGLRHREAAQSIIAFGLAREISSNFVDRLVIREEPGKILVAFDWRALHGDCRRREADGHQLRQIRHSPANPSKLCICALAVLTTAPRCDVARRERVGDIREEPKSAAEGSRDSQFTLSKELRGDALIFAEAEDVQHVRRQACELRIFRERLEPRGGAEQAADGAQCADKLFERVATSVPGAQVSVHWQTTSRAQAKSLGFQIAFRRELAQTTNPPVTRHTRCRARDLERRRPETEGQLLQFSKGKQSSY
eukprot:scaffold2739_cov257-Pinguiococcus_pyrenoidosus.AAC.8